MASDYPDTIYIEGDVLDYLAKHSELIEFLLENQNDKTSLELDKKIMFGNDEGMWKVFLDVFFPEEGLGKLYDFKNGKIIVREDRGGEEAVMNVLRYMLVNQAGTELEFAKAQAKKQINAPAPTVARGVGIRTPGKGARAFLRAQQKLRNKTSYPDFGHENNYAYNGDEEEEEEDEGVKINNNGSGYENEANESNESSYTNESGVTHVTVKTNSNSGEFGKSGARKPLLNFSQMINAAVAKSKGKGSGKGGGSNRRTRRNKKHRNSTRRGKGRNHRKVTRRYRK